MDKVLSARIDESVIQQIGLLSRKLNTSKKNIIEASIKLYSEQTGLKSKIDVFENTCGAWKRSETAQESVLISRGAFNQSMQRHQP